MMIVWLVPLLIILATFILGRLATAALIPTKQQEIDGLSVGFSSVALGVGLIGWIALVLAEAGRYSLETLALIWLALVILLGILVYRKRRSADLRDQPMQDSRKAPAEEVGWKLEKWIQPLFLGAWLLAAGWLFFRPHQSIMGAADAGVYVNLAASIDDKGSIVYTDSTLAGLDASLQDAFLRPLPENPLYNQVAASYLFPGFYVTNAEAGEIVPQFYPLHPVWQATAYGMGGIDAALILTGLWALLGSLAIYLTVKELIGWPAAAIALIGITLNALQVWFARYPTTEALAQFLLWTSVWATLVWIRIVKQYSNRESYLRLRAYWALLAGLMLGQLFLTRIDTYFLLILPVILGVWLRRTKNWQRTDWIYFVTVGLLTLHSLVHAYAQSRPYAVNLFGYSLVLLEHYWLSALAIAAAAGIFLIIVSYTGRGLVIPDRWLRYLKVVVAVTIAAIALYAWFIRPQIGGPDVLSDYWYGGGQIPRNLDRENLVRIGWYLSPISIILATAGTCLMILRINLRTGLVLAAGLSFAFIYIWKIQANPHQIYTMRRYVPAVLPFVVIATSYFLGWLLLKKELWSRAAGAVLTILWFGGLVWSGRGFFSQVDHDGIQAQIARLDSLIDPNSIIIFDDQSAITAGDVIGTPLHFFYGHDVYSVRVELDSELEDLQKTVEEWNEIGRTVYWVGDRQDIELLGLDLGDSFEFSILSQQLEGSYFSKPVNIVQPSWNFEITPIG